MKLIYSHKYAMHNVYIFSYCVGHVEVRILCNLVCRICLLYQTLFFEFRL